MVKLIKSHSQAQTMQWYTPGEAAVSKSRDNSADGSLSRITWRGQNTHRGFISVDGSNGKKWRPFWIVYKDLSQN